jgi:hypothetical protein
MVLERREQHFSSREAAGCKSSSTAPTKLPQVFTALLSWAGRTSGTELSVLQMAASVAWDTVDAITPAAAKHSLFTRLLSVGQRMSCPDLWFNSKAVLLLSGPRIPHSDHAFPLVYF